MPGSLYFQPQLVNSLKNVVAYVNEGLGEGIVPKLDLCYQTSVITH